MKTRFTLKGAESGELFKALSSDTRRGILRLLQRGPMSINALAQCLGVSRSSVTRHIHDLDAAGLVISDNGTGQGAAKSCRLRYEHILVHFDTPVAMQEGAVETEMPLGMYARAEVDRPCGLASATGIIGAFDDPQAFLLPERASARLLWIGRGFVEYLFPNRIPSGAEIARLELAMEICSEMALHRVDSPSDVTVWINGVEIGTWTSFGGFGEKRGRLTPAWWWDTRTQFGMLKVWSVDRDGVYVDGSPVSACTLKDLGLAPERPITVRIGLKPDARNTGAFNLFGRGFGNYDQDLLLRLHYSAGPEDTE